MHEFASTTLPWCEGCVWSACLHVCACRWTPRTPPSQWLRRSAMPATKAAPATACSYLASSSARQATATPAYTCQMQQRSSQTADLQAAQKPQQQGGPAYQVGQPWLLLCCSCCRWHRSYRPAWVLTPPAVAAQAAVSLQHLLHKGMQDTHDQHQHHQQQEVQITGSSWCPALPTRPCSSRGVRTLEGRDRAHPCSCCSSSPGSGGMGSCRFRCACM
jgi:hypothetical protein